MARSAGPLRVAGAIAAALEAIYAVARTLDDKTMSLQYLDMLKAMGANPATKLVGPLELAGLVRPFVEHIAGASEGARAERTVVRRH